MDWEWKTLLLNKFGHPSSSGIQEERNLHFPSNYGIINT